MSQNLIHVSLVMCFYKQYKSEITNFLAHKQDKSIYFGETDEYFILVFNEADVPNFEVWLAETMKLVDYHNNVAFYKLVDKSLLRFETAPIFTMEKVNICLTAEQLCIFWWLRLVINWEYGTRFNPDLLGTYHPASSADYETGWSVRHPKNRNNAMKWGSIPIW